ncbi:hypothetical protein [Streptomyces liangshanensis]|uniref:hypothetical protein n=1 Tax=Streptomyces liangshanensis TaxID=2717324 RepID=UPI0036DF7A54
MPEHKMITINGIRVRAEDEARYRARTGAPAGPLTTAHAHLPGTGPEGGDGGGDGDRVVFDPAEHDVPAVLAYLAEADETETARVLAAEAAGKNRKSILGKEPTP